MTFDTAQLATLITALGGVAATILVATSKRRETRTDQFDAMVRQRDDYRDALNRLRRAYDALLDYVYLLRNLLRDKEMDVPPMPPDARDEQPPHRP